MYLPGLIKLTKDICGRTELRLAEQGWQLLICELEKTISNLPENERLVIVMQYDLEGTGIVSSSAEIAKVLGVSSGKNRKHEQGSPYTRSWISKLRERAFRKLNKCFPVPQIVLDEFIKKNGDYYPVRIEDLLSKELSGGDELSLRAQMKLEQFRIRTIGDLAKKTEAELIKLRFGKKTIDELRDFLESKELRFGLDG